MRYTGGPRHGMPVADALDAKSAGYLVADDGRWRWPAELPAGTPYLAGDVNVSAWDAGTGGGLVVLAAFHLPLRCQMEVVTLHLRRDQVENSPTGLLHVAELLALAVRDRVADVFRLTRPSGPVLPGRN